MATHRVRLEFFFLETGKRWMTRGNNWTFNGTVCNFDPLELNDHQRLTALVFIQLFPISSLRNERPVKENLSVGIFRAERVNHFYCSTGGNGLKVNPTNKKEVIMLLAR